MNISPDGQAIILLCSSLAISRKGEKDGDEETAGEINGYLFSYGTVKTRPKATNV